MLRISVVVTLVAGAVVCSHAQQAAAPAPQSAAAPPPAVVTMQPLGQGVYLLANGGPHAIAALAEDGVVLADAKLASVTTQIKTAIAGLTKQPIRYVITSHNHTANNGGNATLAREGAVIVGHENARRRMAAGSRMERMSIAPFAADALPVVTFSGQFSIHLRGQTITATHVARAHTDSDVVISFKEANVVFGSDLCRSNEYPLIGTTEKGSVDGMIGALETIIALSDAQTKVVCAYGPVMSKIGRAHV